MEISKFYTLDDIMEFNPCYSRAKLKKYMAGSQRISLAGILSSKASDTDKVWLVVRVLPVDKRVEFANWCAKRAKKHATSARYADDHTARTRYTTTITARAARRAARCAASAVSAANTASTHAANAAAYAASSTAYHTERKDQIDRLKEMI